MSTPSLPQHDTDPDARKEALARLQVEYQFDFGYHDIGFAKHVPKRDAYALRVMAKIVESKIALWANRAASRLFGRGDDPRGAAHGAHGSAKARAITLAAAAAARDGSAIATIAKALAPAVPHTIVQAEGDYDALFTLMKKPVELEGWDSDETFAWRRLAGGTPTTLTGVRALGANFPVTEALFQRVVPGDSLDRARGEGRLFVLDYAVFDGLAGGMSNGVQKYAYAPIALFVRTRAAGGQSAKLMPVAIQCSQRPGPDAPLFTPADGLKWKMAKLAVEIADTNWHGNAEHLTRCHMVMEWATLALKRQLAPNHPLRVLLEPHCQWTLANGEVTRSIVINPGGEVDLYNSPSLEDSLERVHKGAVATFRLDESGAPTSFRLRDVDDRERLPEYPFRDDALLLWDAIHAFASGYVTLYYHNDGNVLADAELAAFVRELQASDGGRLRGVGNDGTVSTVAEVVELVAQLIYRATAYHNAINSSGFLYYSLPMSGTYAGYRPPPGAGPVTTSDYLAMLPSIDVAWSLFDALYTQISLHENRLGDYPLFHFRDGRVGPLLKEFRAKLAAAEATIEVRNGARKVPYTLLLPSAVPASIQV
jgi:arachidonate 15-lipoxygenase